MSFFFGGGCKDGANWYAYCANNPLKYTDPNGTDLTDLTDRHEISKFDKEIQDKFIDLYNMTVDKPYAACNVLYESYFASEGYDQILKEINKTPGDTTIEKILRYEQETGNIKTFTSGYEAQKYANEGKDVGVAGEYLYYNKAEKKYKETRHFGIITPSNVSYDEEGNALRYKMSDVELKLEVAGNPNNASGAGPLVTNMGAGNGMVAFSWAFNTKGASDASYDTNDGKTYGTVFILFLNNNNSTKTPTTKPANANVNRKGDKKREIKIEYINKNGKYIMQPVYR